MTKPPTRVLILGGGFGVYAALTLGPCLAAARPRWSLPPLRGFFEQLIEARTG